MYGRYDNDDAIGKPGYFLGNSHILEPDKKVIEADKSTSEKSYSSHLTIAHRQPTLQEKNTMDKFAHQICVAAFLLLGLAQGMTME